MVLPNQLLAVHAVPDPDSPKPDPNAAQRRSQRFPERIKMVPGPANEFAKPGTITKCPR